MGHQEKLLANSNYIIGQKEAKKSVAGSFANRYRRLQLDEHAKRNNA